MSLLKNKVFIYTSSRYATYALQFLNSLLIAKYLGVYYLGVWGFIMLMLQYLLRMNFGISNATNAVVSIHKSKSAYVSEVIGVGITLLYFLSFSILLFFLVVFIFSIDIGSRYSVNEFIPYIVLIAIINHFNLFFSNVFRVYGKLSAITFNQTVLPILTLLTIFLFGKEELLLALLRTTLLASLLSLVYYISTSPVSFKPIINWKLIKEVQTKAIYLFIYNACFYLIVIVTRTFISKYYTVNEFGYFTFAFTLANAILLLFQSMSFLIFPKLLNRFSNGDNEKVISLLNKLRDSYVSISHLSIHLIILLYPFLLVFFPDYRSTSKVFVIIALTVVSYTNSFGYQGLLIAKEKEKMISLIAFIALVFNTVLSYLFIVKFGFSYEYIMIATMVTYFMYIYVISYFGRQLVYEKTTILSTFFDVFPLKWMLPFLISILITFYYSELTYLYSIPLLLFVVLNIKGLIATFGLAKKIYLNSKIIDV